MTNPADALASQQARGALLRDRIESPRLARRRELTIRERDLRDALHAVQRELRASHTLTPA